MEGDIETIVLSAPTGGDGLYLRIAPEKTDHAVSGYMERIEVIANEAHLNGRGGIGIFYLLELYLCLREVVSVVG